MPNVARSVRAILALLPAAALVVACDAHARQPGVVSEAITAGSVDVIRHGLVQGADPNLPVGPHGIRGLSRAARSSQLRVMETLVAGGADPNLADAAGNRWVPLHHAVHKRQAAAVTWLLDHRARADGPDGVRLTPLMMAVASGQTDVVRALLAHGADPRRRTPGGGSLLALAVSGGAFSDLDEPLLGACHPDTVGLIRTAAPELSLGGSWTDRTALAFARLNGCGESIRLAAVARN